MTPLDHKGAEVPSPTCLEARAWEITWRMTLRTTSGLCLGVTRLWSPVQGQREPLCPGCGGGATLEPSSRDLPGRGGAEEKKDI